MHDLYYTLPEMDRARETNGLFSYYDSDHHFIGELNDDKSFKVLYKVHDYEDIEVGKTYKLTKFIEVK